MNKWVQVAAATAVVGAALGMSTPRTAEGVEIGDVVNYTFREMPINGMGVQHLEELRGKPVFVEFWGTR